METSKAQKAYDSSYGAHPLPFRSKEGMNQQLDQSSSPHLSSWAPMKKGKDLYPNINSDKNGLLFSSANKENVRSWLDSTSPTSVLNSTMNQNYVDMHPPTPSPVCSPSVSSYVSMEQTPQQAPTRPPISDIQQNSNNNHLHSQAQLHKKKLEELPSTSRRHGKDSLNEPPPDSPTGSNFSSGSEGGLMALLASKLLSYKENGRKFSRYAREISGPIDEKHVMEDRSQKPAIEDINTAQTHLHPQASDMTTYSRSDGLYRTASESVSEFSLGSANGRTLSMEFDAMLAAAAATGISQASTLEDHHQHQQLPEIQEDSSLRFGRIGTTSQQNDADARALVRVGDERQATFSDDEAGRLTRALTVMRQGRDSEDLDTVSEMPISSQSSISNGSRRGEAEENNNLQIVPTTLGNVRDTPAEVGNLSARGRSRESSIESSSCGSNGDHRLAMVLATHASNPSAESTLSSSSSSSQSEKEKEKNMMPLVPIPPRLALEKVRRNKIFAQALAYQDAKSSKCNNRYKREESKINAWENQQKIKASIQMQKVEMRLEQKRAKALEKMQNEIARAHKAAEERKASAEAIRAAKTAKVAQEADTIRRTGKLLSTNVGCFPF